MFYIQLALKMEKFKKLFPKNYWRKESFIDFCEIMNNWIITKLPVEFFKTDNVILILWSICSCIHRRQHFLNVVQRCILN